jgi:hypothetical protein
MISFTNYEGLKAAVADWLGRDDLAERIPDFIALAERRMARELRPRVLERRAEAEVQAGQRFVPLPWRREPGNWDVFLEMRDLIWQGEDGRRRDLAYLPPDRAALDHAPGEPHGFSISGRDLVLVPAPVRPGKLQLSYWCEPAPLGPKQPDSELLLAAPELYLYASLVESAPYTRGSAPLELWERFYAAARARFENSEQRGRFTSNLCMRPTRRV